MKASTTVDQFRPGTVIHKEVFYRTTFEVGDKVLTTSWGPARIVGEYKPRKVTSIDGDEIDPKAGIRFSLKDGYEVQLESKPTEAYFLAAGDLFELDGGRRHLQLVWPPKTSAVKKTRRSPRKAVSHG